MQMRMNAGVLGTQSLRSGHGLGELVQTLNAQGRHKHQQLTVVLMAI